MIIDKNKVEKIRLAYGLYPPANFAFPGKIKASAAILGTEYLEYVPQKYSTIDITMDDEHIVGHAECSECKRNVEVWVNYCPYCGAKVRGKRVVKKTTVTMDIMDQEENSDAGQ